MIQSREVIFHLGEAYWELFLASSHCRSLDYTTPPSRALELNKMFHLRRLLFASLYVLLLSTTTTRAHEQPSLEHLDAVQCNPAKTNVYRPFVSYHIHVLFWQNNNASVAAAEELQSLFSEKFSITDEANHCDFEAKDVEPQQSDLCLFDIDMNPIGPFTTGLHIDDDISYCRYTY